MKTERFTFTGDQGTQLPAVIWMPDNTPAYILQITHGMTEHMGRYESFATEMTAQGIIVAGFDLRGHGHNPGNDTAALGEGEWDASIRDMKAFFDHLSQRFPGIPHYLHGHSLGSFLLRDYLERYPQGIAGAIIMGTGNQPDWLLKMIMYIVKKELQKNGYLGSSRQIQQLSFGSYNQKFKPNRTPMDWLCADEAELDLYRSDPLCREKISAGLFYQMLESMRRVIRQESCEKWNKTMPVLLLSGQDDPVGNMGKGALSVKRQLDTAGIESVEFHLFPKARHLLFNERKSGVQQEVFRIISDFISSK